MTKYFAALLMFFVAWPSFAADPNGYTAQYECRAGGQYCNVDVAALGNRACDQIVSTSTPWSSIKWSSNTICIEAGDHTSKGILTIRSSSSGNTSNRKVLRYYRATEEANKNASSDDNPWQQSANQAKLAGIYLDGASYWVIHRLTINGNKTSSHAGIYIYPGSNSIGNIFNRNLVENFNYTLVGVGMTGNDNNTFQNSVFREAISAGNTYQENQCVALEGVSTNIRLVNNEIYNCNKGIYASPGFSPHPGLVIENNDIYITPSRYTDCRGNFNLTGPCSDTEGVAIDSKGGSTASNIGRIIHNRMWGMRPGDGQVAQPGGGWGVSFSNTNDESTLHGTDYWLVQNNIIWDMDLAFWNYYKGPDHNSIIGNLVYNVFNHGGQQSNSADVGGVSFKWLSSSEFYLNTFINANPIILGWGNDTNNDIRCNLYIGGGSARGSYGSGTTIDQNVFYGVKMITTGSSGTNVMYASATDAKMTEYCFYNRLRTGPEKICIPNARPTQDSPHLKACPSNTGSRGSIGVDNLLLR